MTTQHNNPLDYNLNVGVLSLCFCRLSVDDSISWLTESLTTCWLCQLQSYYIVWIYLTVEFLCSSSAVCPAQTHIHILLSPAASHQLAGITFRHDVENIPTTYAQRKPLTPCLKICHFSFLLNTFSMLSVGFLLEIYDVGTFYVLL